MYKLFIQSMLYMIYEIKGGLGGNGQSGGASQLFADCGGSTSVGCGYLGKIKAASESMMVQRAKVSQNKNFMITQHYPGLYMFFSFFSSVLWESGMDCECYG